MFVYTLNITRPICSVVKVKRFYSSARRKPFVCAALVIKIVAVLPCNSKTCRKRGLARTTRKMSAISQHRRLPIRVRVRVSGYGQGCSRRILTRSCNNSCFPRRNLCRAGRGVNATLHIPSYCASNFESRLTTLPAMMHFLAKAYYYWYYSAVVAGVYSNAQHNTIH